MLRAALADGARLYARSFGTLITIAAILLVPLDLALAAAGDDIASLLLVVGVAAYGIAEGAIVVAVLAPSTGVAGAVRQAFRRAWPLIAASLLTAGATLVGLLLLVVPGIIVAARLAVGAQVVMIEGLPARDALARSWQLVSGRTWRVLLIVLVAQAPFVAATVASIRLDPSPAFVVTALSDVIVFPFTVAVLVALYRRLTS